jgi:hypothetical protein
MITSERGARNGRKATSPKSTNQYFRVVPVFEARACEIDRSGAEVGLLNRDV